MPSLNIADPIMKGLNFANQRQRQQQTDDLNNSLLQLQGAGVDITQTPEFQQLQILDPQKAGAIQGNSIAALQSKMNLDNSRIDAMFKDAQVARGLLDVGQDRALRFLDERLELISQMGGNPADTLEIRELIANGDMQGARKLLDDVIKAGQQSGFLQSPTGSPKKAVGQTGLVFDPATGSFTLDQTAVARIDALNNKKNENGGLGAKDRQSINKDITGFIKDANLIKNTATDLETLKDIGSGPASIAAVFKFMKALDPTSVVREGEFATAENSAGVPEGISNFYNRMIRGERLGDTQFKQFVDTAKGLANNAIGTTKQTVDGYLNTFEDTLPVSFMNKVQQRVPTLFEIQQAEQPQQQTQTQQQVFEVDF